MSDNKEYTVQPNDSGGPGYCVVNRKGRSVAWVYEQPYGGPDKERAELIAEMLNQKETTGHE